MLFEPRSEADDRLDRDWKRVNCEGDTITRPEAWARALGPRGGAPRLADVKACISSYQSSAAAAVSVRSRVD